MVKMRNIISFICLGFMCSPILAQTGTISVKINGIASNSGVIQIGLYNEESGFPEYKESFKGVSPKANKMGVTYTFTEIPIGPYAIAVWHDENENKKLDKNLFGVPKEKYGFSNNVYRTMGPPKYEEALFIVEDKKEISLIIDMK
jgi:uncharacterized protein (DUF2141 family)